MEPPWEHPDWYDMHDTAFTAGSEREPEHYRECVLALPPLGRDDHLVDIGAGTGKLTRQIADAYPELGHVTLIEPNAAKLVRARDGVARRLPHVHVNTVTAGLGDGPLPVDPPATVIVIGSVLMPIMEYRGGTLRDGLAWLARGLAEIAAILPRGGTLCVAETIGVPWARGDLDRPVRRLQLPELLEQFAAAGLPPAECCYRFRDRVVLRVRA
jgi:SAM-dependent methyltransferase